MDAEDARVGGAVKKFRLERGLSQAQFAEEMTRAGHPMQQQTVLKIERGSRSLRFTEAVAIALVLDVTLRDLCDPEPMPEDLLRLRRAAFQIARMATEATALLMDAEADSALLAEALERRGVAGDEERIGDFTLSIAGQTAEQLVQAKLKAMRQQTEGPREPTRRGRYGEPSVYRVLNDGELYG